MKHIKKLLLCAAAVLLAGCMKMRMTYDVTKEGDVTASYRMLVSTSFIESMGANVEEAVAELQQKMQEQYPDGKTKLINEKYGEDNYTGFEITDIKNEALKAEVKNGNVTLTIPRNSVEQDVSDTIGVDDSSIDVSSLKQHGLELTMIVNMPGAAKSNVGTVNGKTVTIDLLEAPSDVTEFVISSGSGSVLPWIIGGCAVIVAAGAAFVAFMKLRK